MPALETSQPSGAEVAALQGYRLLWVESKGVYCGVGCYGSQGNYRSLLARYRAAGAEIDVTEVDPLRAETLAGYDMVWISLPANWESAFTPAEAEIIGAYVEAGGALQLLSDAPDTPNSNLATVAERLGFQIGTGGGDYYAFTIDSLFGRQVVLTAGVGTVSGGKAWAEDAYTKGVVGVMGRRGDGRVLILGDSNAFTNISLRAPMGDNATVSDLGVSWLLDLPSTQIFSMPQ